LQDIIYIIVTNLIKKVTYILLVIIGFLFLHSETEIFSICHDNHENHDICVVFDKSDIQKTGTYRYLLQNTNPTFVEAYLSIFILRTINNNLLKESKYYFKFIIKKEKRIQFLSILQI
jgi:hypothetical protein